LLLGKKPRFAPFVSLCLKKITLNSVLRKIALCSLCVFVFKKNHV
jgi:hypothetical protein